MDLVIFLTGLATGFPFPLFFFTDFSLTFGWRAATVRVLWERLTPTVGGGRGALSDSVSLSEGEGEGEGEGGGGV